MGPERRLADAAVGDIEALANLRGASLSTAATETLEWRKTELHTHTGKHTHTSTHTRRHTLTATHTHTHK